ncbi:MAG: B-box zinc finger protein [Anaerolineae bacterium]
MAEEVLTYCEVHPDRETALRCNKCGRLMCAECAVSTPVGYRCKQCVRQHEDRFFSASQNDYVVVAAICVLLAAIGGYIATAIGGFIILMFFIGIPVGGGIAELALRATKRRRGRYSGEVGAAAAAVGALIGGLVHTYGTFASTLRASGVEIPPEVASAYLSPEAILRQTLSDGGLLLFMGVVAFFVYSRFKMRA